MSAFSLIEKKNRGKILKIVSEKTYTSREEIVKCVRENEFQPVPKMTKCPKSGFTGTFDFHGEKVMGRWLG